MLNLAPAAAYSLPVSRATLCLFMPTRLPRTVAALTADDALALLRFDGQRLTMDEIDREYLDQVAGGHLSPMLPRQDQSCLYVQSRRLVAYDFAARKPRLFRLTGALEEMPVRAEWCAASESSLVVEIQDTSHYANSERIDVHLRAYHVRGPRVYAYAERTWTNCESLSWDAAQQRVLVCGAQSGVQVFDENLVPLPTHPLQNGRCNPTWPSRGVLHARFHPSLPVAMFLVRESVEVDGPQISVWRIAWTDAEHPTAERIAAHDAAGHWHAYSYSPSGNWFVYGVERSRRTQLFAIHADGVLRDVWKLGTASLPVMPLWFDKQDTVVTFDGETDWVTVWDLSEA